jgi:hypothetical protein
VPRTVLGVRPVTARSRRSGHVDPRTVRPAQAQEGRPACRDAFATAMSGALASPLRSVRTTVEILDERFVLADLAIVSCLKTVHDERAAAEAPNALPSTEHSPT